MQLPSLKAIAGGMIASGARKINVPKLRFVGGHFVVDGTGLAELPPNREHIGGNAVISSSKPPSLLAALIKAKSSGVLKGEIIIDRKPYRAAPPATRGGSWWKLWK